MEIRLNTCDLAFELIQIGDRSYTIKVNGSQEASCRFDFAFKLALANLGVNPLSRGYSGCGRLSSSSFDTRQPLEIARAITSIKDFAELEPWDLAGQLNQSGLLGPKPGEFLGNLVNMTSGELKSWAINYYQANGIDDPNSFDLIERNHRFSYSHVDLAELVHNLKDSFSNPIKVLAYRLLLRQNHQMPPLICRRRGWELYEGYHRLSAHQAEDVPTAACVVIG